MEIDLDDRGGGHGHGYGGGVELAPIMRKPSRLEALPTLSRMHHWVLVMASTCNSGVTN